MATAPTVISIPPTTTDGIVAGTTNPAIAAQNRTIIENTYNLKLPEGNIDVDQAPCFKSGVTVTAHKNGSIITNNHYGATYGLNCSGMITTNFPMEYINNFTKLGPKTIQCLNLKNYKVNDVVYFWVWDGYMKPIGAKCFRTKLTAIIDGDIGNLADELPADVPWDQMKLLHGYQCNDIPAGQGYIETKWASSFGNYTELFVTMGPIQANEIYGRYVDIDHIDTAKNRIYIKQPLNETYTQAAVVKVRPVTDTTFNGVTFGRPIHSGSHSFFGTQIRRITFNECTATYGPFGFGNSQGIKFNNCTGILSLNQAYDSEVRGSAYNVAYEEGCYDNRIIDCLIFNPTGGQHGIYANGGAPCGRFFFQNVKIANMGYNWGGGGNGSPLAGPFHDTLMRNIEISGRNPDSGVQSYTGGNNLQIDGLKILDSAISFGGTNISLSNIRGPIVYLGWVNEGTPSSGTAYNCAMIQMMTDKWQTVSCQPYAQAQKLAVAPAKVNLEASAQLLSQYRRSFTAAA